MSEVSCDITTESATLKMWLVCVRSLISLVILLARYAVSDEHEESGEALVYHGVETQPPSVPWHAGIYQPVAGAYSFLCGGTLISPVLVVTAAHCFWDENRGRPMPNLTAYTVALGKFYRAWHLDTASQVVQRVGVRQVALHPRFRGYRRKLEYDVALVELMSSVNLTSSVGVVGLDWDRRLDNEDETSSEGVVAGWGIFEGGEPSEILRSISLPYIDHDLCYETLSPQFSHLMTSDKFCAGFINETRGLCRGDSGGGLVYRGDSGGLGIVRGVVSVNFRPSGFQGDCYAENYAGFTNIAEARTLEWIIKAFPAVRSSSKCPPLSPSANEVIMCTLGDASVACQAPVMPGTVATVTCKGSGRVNSRTGQRVSRERCKHDGQWSQLHGSCIAAPARQCPPQTSTDAVVVTKCLLRGDAVDCTLPMPPHTRAIMRCKTGFFSAEVTTKAATCTKNGEWTSPILCTPDCGKRRRNDVHTMTINGEDVEVGDILPWHVLVYRRTRGGVVEETWGGTLITPFTVVTNAFIVYDGWNVTIDPTLFTVAAGKYFSSMHVQEEGAQARNVSRIFMHDQYDYDAGNQAHDIALLRVDTRFTMSWDVNVVCLDWDNLWKPMERGFVTVAGWKKGTNTSLLMSTPTIRTILSRTSCRDLTAPSRRQYVTPDKVCATTAVGGGVCGAPDGAGMTATRRTARGVRHYLLGVRSVMLEEGDKRDGCGDAQVVGFTQVTVYRDWIKHRLEGGAH